MDESVIRESIVDLLTKGHAHVPVSEAVANVAASIRFTAPGPGLHTPWELLEHLRLAQEDILRYTLDPSWTSPEFPAGYWPLAGAIADEAAWEDSVRRFLSDLGEVVALVRDPARDLTSLLPHGEGRTYLRQVLLVADHNAYHAAQLVDARKQLGDWR